MNAAATWAESTYSSIRAVTVDPDKPPTDEETYAAKPMPPQMVALGRSGTIEDAANSIFYLCSPMSDYTTGQVLAVNGGARGGMS